MATMNQTPNPTYNHVVFLIDCKLSMFIYQPSQFKKAIAAIYNFYDSTVIENILPKNYLCVLLLHPDPSKQVLINFDMSPKQAYRKIFQLKQCTNIQIKEMYGTKNTGIFNKQLKKAMKMLWDKSGRLFFFTTERNPTTTPQDKRETLSYFKDTYEWKTKFKIMGKLECHNAFCQIFKLPKENGISCDGIDTLTDKLLETVFQDNLGYKINLYPYLGSNLFITCSIYGLKEDPVVADDNTKRKEANKFVDPLKTLSQRKLIPVGICPIEASIARDGPYVDIGLHLRPTLLLGDSNKSQRCFSQFWDTMKDLYLLCYLKFEELGQIYTIEMTDVKIQGEKYFEMRFIPCNLELQHPIDYEPYGGIIPLSFPAKEKERDKLYDKIFKKMTLPRINELLNGTANIAGKQQESIRADILGSQYKMNVDEPKESSNTIDEIDKISSALETYSATEHKEFERLYKFNDGIEVVIVSDSEDEQENLSGSHSCISQHASNRRPLVNMAMTQ